jgi:predicted MFS family arabinose efflux permease
VPAATAAALLVFTNTAWLVWIGAGVWGSVMGLQESTLRAAVADMIPGHKRGMAYGVFNGLYGFALLAGSTAMGVLYGESIGLLVGLVVAIEALAFGAGVSMIRATSAPAKSR